MHMNRELQNDFNALGEDEFTFEVLDRLQPKEDPHYDYGHDLQTLEAIWIEKLQPSAARDIIKRSPERGELRVQSDREGAASRRVLPEPLQPFLIFSLNLFAAGGGAEVHGRSLWAAVTARLAGHRCRKPGPASFFRPFAPPATPAVSCAWVCRFSRSV